MTQFECRKVDNCFGGTHIYEYRFALPLNEERINGLGMVGLLKFHRNFPRPFFQVSLADGTTIKGVLNDTVIKVSFPNTDHQKSKGRFELLLQEWLSQQMDGRER